MRTRAYINKILSWMLLICILFPYVTFGIDFFKENYIQPYALIISIIILILNPIKINLNKELISFIAITLCLLLILLSSVFFNDFQKFQSRFNIGYLSPFIFLISLRSNYILFTVISKNALCKFLIATTFIYLIVALIQMYVYSDFLTNFVGGYKVGLTGLDGGRGAISLASEPSYYAFHMISIAAALFILEKGKIYFIALLQIFITALSTTAIATFFLSMSLYFIFLSKKNIKSLITMIVVIVAFIFIFTSIFIDEDYRVSVLFKMLLNGNIDAFVYIDQSSSERMVNIVYPFLYTFENFLIPSSLLEIGWSDYLDQFNLPWFNNLPPNIRIMSGFGELVVNYGLFSAPLIYLFIYKIMYLNPSFSPNSKFFTLLLFLMIMGTYSLSTPILAFLYILYDERKKNQSSN